MSESIEYDLPAVEVPATLSGVTHALTDLRAANYGEQYIHVEIHNGSLSNGALVDSTGRRFPVRSGQPGSFSLETLGRGVTYLAWIPDGDIEAAEITIIPTVRRPAFASA